jgi:hypothetical protein
MYQFDNLTGRKCISSTIRQFENLPIRTNEIRTSDGRNFGIRKLGIQNWNVVPENVGVFYGSLVSFLTIWYNI